MRQIQFREAHAGAAITVRVTPNARANKLVGLMDNGTLKVKVAAPAVEGTANEALLDLLAATLEVRARDLEIVAGERSRDKLITVMGLDAATVQQRILARLGQNPRPRARR
ncbi:MAG: DUF167 domain-containing protein [Chloroflexi bacterium]|nr:DUF167 domain-containing protein [Chloroflexota bacterium]